MATKTIKETGETIELGESEGEFKARQKKEVTKRKSKKKSKKRIEKIGGKEFLIEVEKAPIVAVTKEGRSLTKTDLLIEKNKSLIQQQPKGSKRITQADGTVVFRTHGRTAQGIYVKDVYQRLQEDNRIKKRVGQYKNIPATAKKIITPEGVIYRNVITSSGKTFVSDFKPGGIKETKVLTKSFIGGASQFIPVKKKEKKEIPIPKPEDFIIKPKDTPKPGKSLSIYAETLIKREGRISKLKGKVFKTLRITGKENAKFYNPLEVGKAVLRFPFEIATIPTVIYGRGSLIIRSIFDKAGRKELKESVFKTPGAIREVFIHKDPESGKFQFTAQNVANVGLIGFGVRGVAKRPSNVGLKVYEKYAKTNIKGSITGFQSTTVFKSAGKFQGRPYKELTVLTGKRVTTSIKYEGKTFIINRGPTGAGTFKILKLKTSLKIPRKGLIPKGVKFEKEFITIQEGSFKPGGQAIPFKTGKGTTTQDILFLNKRPLTKSYIAYLEKLKTTAEAQKVFKAGKQTLKFDAKTKIDVKTDITGVISKQKTKFKEIDYSTNKQIFTEQYKTPIIQFSKKPVNPKDLIVSEYLKDTKGTITGFKAGGIIQPRHSLTGIQKSFIKGKFEITGKQYKPFNIFKKYGADLKRSKLPKFESFKTEKGKFEIKTKIEFGKIGIEGVEGYYQPPFTKKGIGKIKIDKDSPTFDARLRHEITHALDLKGPQTILQKLTLKNKNPFNIQALKDVVILEKKALKKSIIFAKSKGIDSKIFEKNLKKITPKRIRETTFKKYSNRELEIEARAYISEKFPGELKTPTTETGIYLKRLFTNAKFEYINSDTAILKIKVPATTIFKPISKPKPITNLVSKQIALTEQIKGETIYNIPFQSQTLKIEFSGLNFDLIQAPTGKIKPGKILPILKAESISKELKTHPDFKQPLTEIKPVYKVKTFQEVRPVETFKVSSNFEQIQKPKSIIKSKAGQRGRTSTIQKTKTITEQAKKQIGITKQSQILKQEIAFDTVLKTNLQTSKFQPLKFNKPIIPKILGAPFLLSSTKLKREKGFDVFTRIKGVFKKANIKPLSKLDAINYGAYQVGTTSQATFKIGEANAQVQDVFNLKGNLKDFYKKDGLFIEKRGRRIKSIGELQEITFKGIQSRKTKNIFGGK